MPRDKCSTPRGSASTYREAARLMEEDNMEEVRGSCCWAIGIVKDPTREMFFGEKDADCRAMKRVYAPRAGWGFWLQDIGDTDAERHEARILALCFMAAMVEAGDA